MSQAYISAFLKLEKLFCARGHKLYLVGGTVRDYLLQRPLTDMDLATSATPKEMIEFLDHVDTSFIKYGNVKCVYEGVKFEITTLRTESGYKDYRHPSEIKYVKDIKLDYIRRDFTINALYMDSYFKIYDFCHGEQDIKDRLIRFIGKPKKRVIEDPLRILRAIRFALKLGFSFEKKTMKAMKKYSYLLENISKDKIRMELNKFTGLDKAMKEHLFIDFGITQFIDVIE